MKKIYIFLLAASTLWCNTACDSLDLTSESTISGDGYWQNKDQFEAFHTGLASYFRGHTYTCFVYGEGRSNIYGDTPFGGEAPQGIEVLYNNTLSVTTPGISNYGGLYNSINQINLMIAKAEESTVLTDAEKSEYLGEAYGLRAYLYFQLLRSYGDVIIYTDYTSGSTLDLGNLARKQDPAEKVMEQIKSDIAASETAYADNYQFMNGKNFWSLGATKMLKGDVYLWSGKQMGGGASDYQTAKDALEDVKKCPGIGLEANYANVFSYSNKKNKEIIFSIYYAEGEDLMFGGYQWRNNFMPQQAYMTNGGYYTESGENVRDTKDAEINGLIRFSLKRDLYNKLYLDSDPRKRINLRGVYTKNAESGALEYLAAYPYKFQGTMLSGGSERSWYDDFPIYRYADCLLMLAEAKALLGEDITAEINEVRTRAYGGNLPAEAAYPNDKGSFYDGNEFVGGDENPIEAVLKERLRELIFEGKRWYDIRLMGVAEKYSTAVGSKLLWPVDEGTLTDNNALVQTPGYGVQ